MHRAQLPQHKYMKLKSLFVIAGILSLIGFSSAEEAKKAKKEVSAEILAKYDKDKDGKLSKEEKAELKKDKAAAPKAPKGDKKKKE
jgi:hypothetical protein